MKAVRKLPVAPEGLPVLGLLLLAAWAVYRYAAVVWLAVPLPLFVLAYLVFRDPPRSVPSRALGIVSPVDGKVIDLKTDPVAGAGQPCRRLLIRIDPLGTYAARAPVEGYVRDPAAGAEFPARALWIQTDEGDDVVMHFKGYRFGLAPKGFTRYGERLGQGERCVYLRLVRDVELLVPRASKLDVEPGQRVTAGRDVLGTVPKS